MKGIVLMRLKLLFPVLMLTAAVLGACVNNTLPKDDDPFVTDVDYSDDWRYITLFLDESMITINNSVRGINPTASVMAQPSSVINTTASGIPQPTYAMTQDSARKSFDYFEVCFHYEGLTARASWEIGKRASIENVYRTSSGINYANTGITPGQGAAILFAGRKTDKSLLAVGRIIQVDEEPGTVITNQSGSVTFELFALTGNAARFDRRINNVPVPAVKTSSFLTAAKGSPDFTNVSEDNTNVAQALIGTKRFPIYKLPSGKSDVRASYTFTLAGGYAKGDPIFISWNEFSQGIIVASIPTEGGVAEMREARYPAGSGNHWYADYAADQSTNVEMINNRAGSGPAQNPVIFKIDTSNTINPVTSENGIFTLSFKIPVFALTSFDAYDDEMWHIRPAFATYYYNMDNGADSTGGALLMGVEAPDDFEIGARWG